MIEIKTNKTFDELDESPKRISIFQGGARSGKTYNIILWLITKAAEEPNPQIYTVCRATMPALKGSSYRDFIEILQRAEGYNVEYSERNHNKSDLTYQLNNTTFEFISIDQPQKIRGRKRKVLFINEANEIDLESWRQLSMRTTDKIILDYNPSMEYHWIYDEVLERSDSDFYQSTYKDNPFLEPSIILEIERLKDIDSNYWKIYGLGERGSLSGLIFKNWQQIETMPDVGIKIYGLDFGYSNDPTAMVEVRVHRHEMYVRELIYATGLQNRETAALMLREDVDRYAPIYADSAEPKSIDEIYSLGFNCKPCVKGADSIINGINVLLQYNIHVTSDSINLIKELRNYKYIEDKNGRTLNKPIDLFNHAIDAMRYAMQTHFKPQMKEQQIIFRPTRTNKI